MADRMGMPAGSKDELRNIVDSICDGRKTENEKEALASRVASFAIFLNHRLFQQERSPPLKDERKALQDIQDFSRKLKLALESVTQNDMIAFLRRLQHDNHSPNAQQDREDIPSNTDVAVGLAWTWGKERGKAIHPLDLLEHAAVQAEDDLNAQTRGGAGKVDAKRNGDPRKELAEFSAKLVAEYMSPGHLVTTRNKGAAFILAEQIWLYATGSTPTKKDGFPTKVEAAVIALKNAKGTAEASHPIPSKKRAKRSAIAP